MRLAIDVMGGDNAPVAIVKGCLDALSIIDSDDQLILVGDADVVRATMEAEGVSDERIIVHPTTEIIGMDESPVDAVRAKGDSSLVQMVTLGSARKTREPVDVIISAGNTGACVSAATMYMKRLPGVHRPGIACALPTLHGPVVVCDVGANPEPRPLHLAQYAEMADIYARRVLNIKTPRVAQMNIGAEEAKGTEMTRNVRDLLRATPELNYIGYVEGRDVFEGAADVIVCDGFVGNTMLKLAEGLARSLIKGLVEAVMSADPTLAGQLKPIMADVFRRNDYHEYGGAPLMGVNGTCFICHGSSEARTIRNAIRAARDYVAAGVNDAIVERIAKLESGSQEPSTPGEAA